MKVVIATDGLFPLVKDDRSRSCRYLAEALARVEGMELTVLHPHATGVFDAASGIAEVQVPPCGTGERSLFRHWRYSVGIAKALRRLDADVVLSFGFSVWSGIGGSPGKLIVHPYALAMFQAPAGAPWSFDALRRWAMRRIIRKAHAVISLGGKLTPLLQGIVKGSKTLVVAIPDAVWPPVEAVQVSNDAVPDPVPGRPLELFFPGSDHTDDGTGPLIRTAERWAAEGKTDAVRFTLVAEERSATRWTAHGLPPNVSLLGPLDEAQRAARFRDCDAVLSPERRAGMPQAALVAMAYAKPVFIADAGAASELVSMHNGYLLPPDDAEAWCQAVAAFCERSPGTRVKMGRYGLERARELFSGPVVARRYMELFRSITQP